jgi:hypothetical protein
MAETDSEHDVEAEVAEQAPPRFKLPRIDPNDAAVARARANPRDCIGISGSSFRWRPE